MHTLMHGLGIASFGCISGQSDLWFHRIALRIDIQIYLLLSLHIVVKCDDGHSLVNSPKRTFVLYVLCDIEMSCTTDSNVTVATVLKLA